MKQLRIVVFILIFSGFFGSRCEATVYHSNGTAASVQSIHDNQAQNGDTITLPAGTFLWTSGVRITKAITLQGAGVGSTVIKDDVQGPQLIYWDISSVSNQVARLTGIEFQDGGRINRGLAPGGVLHVDGINTNGSQFRWDHCKWNDLHGFIVFDTVIGVIDHNIFIRDSGKEFMTYVYGSRWNGGVNGDASWAAPSNYGSSQFLFFEDNSYISNVPPYSSSATDGLNGCRFVVRHNTLFDTEVENHGTESGGRERGSREMEIYGNTFTGSDITNSLGGSRSGGTLLHDNTISGHSIGPPVVFNLGNWRNFYPFNPWGGADGTNQWDVNNPVFGTGRAAANSSGTTVKVSGANWTPNYCAGYTIRRTSNVCGSNSITFAWIIANTSNTISYTDNGGYPIPNLSFCAGDSFEIRKVEHALDQPGRAGGSLITGYGPTRPAGWNNQVTEPCYSWNNTSDNGQVNFSAGPGVRANEHYFNNTPMPGYTPYVYPHPLVTGAGRAVVADFNGDGSPDFVLQNASIHQTAIWYLDNNVFAGGAYGPTLFGDWGLAAAAHFNRDTHADYVLVNAATNQTGIWYLSGPTLIGGAYGPTPPRAWELVATADFDGDGNPDYLLYNPTTRQTAIWYLTNNVFAGGAYGPTLPAGWSLVAVADFNRDGHPDFLLFAPSTGQTAIWYLSGPTFIGGAYGPTMPGGWAPVAAADFNGDGNPDYVLYNPSTRRTAIWYLTNNVFAGGAYGPTLPVGWSLIAQ